MKVAILSLIAGFAFLLTSVNTVAQQCCVVRGTDDAPPSGLTKKQKARWIKAHRRMHQTPSNEPKPLQDID